MKVLGTCTFPAAYTNPALQILGPFHFDRRRIKNPPRPQGGRGGRGKKSGDTYSRTFGTTIGSESLTTVFGMGTGVAFQIWSPERSGRRR